ncbi:hypothetical protein DK847_12915 [Aestuariivirga litoralis]|uniref:Uncharacterized protein n=1 Tax=Aestuariivirga litoralis TaxID=2650924 RepID=A0A2W2BTB2_9HYPH|nr:hypothetical protein [Aestuariivirga litoralis]PZF76686.1 hypothetical protein DK847_12915 [Aestuariivirga litoralis]
MVAKPCSDPPPWLCPLHRGPVGESIVIYPEVVPGNPLGARKVIRWVLNDPGLLGGQTFYSDYEMVFVYDPQKLPVVNRSLSRGIGRDRVLWTGLVDPSVIYPDASVTRTIDCSFTHKGRALSQRFPLPHANILRLEDLTASFRDLGDTLRKTKVLYSYDHYSNVLREAVICGCDVRVIGEDGVWHDPRTCGCPLNILWQPDLLATYADHFNSSDFIIPFVRTVETRWPVRSIRLPSPAARTAGRAARQRTGPRAG